MLNAGLWNYGAHMKLHQDQWPEPLTKGQEFLKSVGETPNSMRHHNLRDAQAQEKRAWRIERNIRNAAKAH
jgi:hypothetical protein